MAEPDTSIVIAAYDQAAEYLDGIAQGAADAVKQSASELELDRATAGLTNTDPDATNTSGPGYVPAHTASGAEHRSHRPSDRRAARTSQGGPARP